MRAGRHRSMGLGKLRSGMPDAHPLIHIFALPVYGVQQISGRQNKFFSDVFNTGISLTQRESSTVYNKPFYSTGGLKSTPFCATYLPDNIILKKKLCMSSSRMFGISSLSFK